MRTFETLVPRGDMNPADADLWKRLNAYLQQTSKAWANVARQVTPDQSQTTPPTPPLIDDHGLLKGLVPVLNPDGTVADYNDDHTQYPLIFGRPAGQSIYGSRPGTAVTWSPRGSFMVAKSTSGGAASWTTTTSEILSAAPINTGIILCVSTRTANTLAGGETNYHTGITDTGGNTWTKLKEFSYNYSGASTLHTSLWFCLVSANALTPGVNTLTVAFSTADHIRYAAEGYSFDMASGLSVTLVAYATDASAITATGGTSATSMSLSAVTGDTLFVRAMGDQPSSDITIGMTPSGGFTDFAADHTGSTNNSPALGFGQNVRGEFVVRNGVGATSAPFYVQDGQIHTMASIFGAIQISGTSIGSLTLGAANQSDSAKIFLENRDVRLAAGLTGGAFKFDPLGSSGFVGILNFDNIAASDKTYTFPNVSGTVLLNSGSLIPSADNTFDLGSASFFWHDLYLGNDLIPKTDGVMDIGTAAVGISQEHYAYPTSTGTLRAIGKGMLWEDATLGDIFVGADNQYGVLGYYSQRVTKANSSAIDQSEDASNFIQGSWGSGANPTYPFLEMQYIVGKGTVGRYPFGEDGTTYIRDGATTMGIYGTSLGQGGGGLVLGSLGLAPGVGGSGVYLHFDETNKRFNIRTMSGPSASGMANQRLSQIGFAGTRLTVVLPVTDTVVDLGASGNRWLNIFYNGTLTSSIAGNAISLADGGNVVLGTTTGSKIGTGTTQLLGFYNAAPVAQQGATTDLGTALSNLGLRAAGTAYPITTSGALNLTGTITLGGQVTVSDTINFALNTSTGTKIGTGTTQKLGFWNAAPIAQPTTGIAASTFVANTSGIANDTATWDGFTIGQAIKALRNMGLLA